MNHKILGLKYRVFIDQSYLQVKFVRVFHGIIILVQLKICMLQVLRLYQQRSWYTHRHELLST